MSRAGLEPAPITERVLSPPRLPFRHLLAAMRVKVSVLSVCLVRARLARQLGGIGVTTPRALAPAHLLIIALLAGCGTTALKPEPKLVSSVTSLPPVQTPIPVRCVKPIGGCVGSNPMDKCKEMPPIPPNTIDPNGTPLQRYYQTKADLLALDDYKIKANAALLACAVEEPPK